MKTIKDVYAVYKEWPLSSMTHVIVSDVNGIGFMHHTGKVELPSHSVSYTREEYEQYKAEQDSKNMKAEWYDYDNGEMISRPSEKTRCEFCVHGSAYFECEVLFMGNVMCVLGFKGDEVGYSVKDANFRPLDHDKHKVQNAPIEWMIECGLDAEFSSDRDSRWFISNLHVLNERGEFVDGNKDRWRNCRPRMNHKHVLTYEQVKLIPDCFDINMHLDFSDQIVVVEFKGLKDGYKYEYDK